MGFSRRYDYFPGNEEITRIEGVVILDIGQPGSIQGVENGRACLIGEFADMTYATAVSSTGVVSTSCRPVDVTGPTDMVDKLGGWDSTLGNFGVAGGNGYAELFGQSFGSLCCVPVNLCSAAGIRVFRQLPTCTSTASALPVVSVAAASVEAGREFRSGAGRMHIGKRVGFTAKGIIASGLGGQLTANGGPIATCVFSGAAGLDWTTIARPDGGTGAKKGDILVFGSNLAGVVSPAEGGTYRVAADPASGVNITLQRLDGATFTTLLSAATVPWRLHYGTDADSAPLMTYGSSVPGGYIFADAGGFTVPVRPITNQAGGATDGNWTAASVLTPATVPPALTGTTWDPLSGLGGAVNSTVAVAFAHLSQAPNAPADATIDALYITAIDSTIDEQDPAASIGVLWTARVSSSIRAKVKSNQLEASKRCRGRIGINSPELTTVTTTAAIATSDPGAGANRAERLLYTWPGRQVLITDAIGTFLACADGTVTNDGVLDMSASAKLASIISNLRPELNPGQASEPVPTLMADVKGIQRGVGRLQMDDYILMRQYGICGLKIDRKAGPIFQSGVTTSLTSGQININRRRMADFVEDSLADRLIDFSKQPMTIQMQDNVTTELTAFGEELLSINDPGQQRIAVYTVDDLSGNTKATRKANMFVTIFKVEMVPTGDFIVAQCQVGLGVLDITVT